jgi:glycosyltransferase involved in cell wall biosynthesis
VALVHVHTSSRASFWRKSAFFVLAFAFGVPAILHLHGSEFAVFHDRECGVIRRRFVRWIFDRSARVLVLSQAWRDWVRGMCNNPNVQVLYNPVSIPPAIVPTQRERGRLLFLGRLGKRKGTYDLIEAVTRLAPVHPDLRLFLGGDGDVDAVNARAHELGVAGRVKALGWVRNADKQAQLGRASIYVLPSYHEGLPMSILEAMAAGLPVVSTNVGGIPEAVRDGAEGFLVEPGDIDSLADRLRRLLVDPEVAAQMGCAARARADALFSAAAVLPQLEEVWASLRAGGVAQGTDGGPRVRGPER